MVSRTFVGLSDPKPFNLSYHEPALVIEWRGHTCSFLLDNKPLWHWGKRKNWPTSKRDIWPRHRPTGKCPLYSFETTGQLLHSAVGSNQVGCSCSWQRSLSRKTNTGTTKEIPALNQSWRGCNHPSSNCHTKSTKSHILSRGQPTACHHCGQTLTIGHMLLGCADECRDEYYTADSLDTLFETIPETCLLKLLWEVGFFYLIWMVKHSTQFLTRFSPIWCNLLTSISPQTWTIWSSLSNLFREWKQLWGTLLV